MSLIKINPVAGKTYQDAWDTIDANVDESIIDLDVNGAGTQFRLKKFDGTYTSFKAITFPVATANNGLTPIGNAIKLGGTLTGGTTIDTDTFNFLLQSGSTAQRLRISNTFAEINGALELRISPPSIDASSAIVDQVLKVKNASTGRCEYEYIKSSDFTSLLVNSNKIRLTFKDASFIETGIINTLAQTNTAINYAVVDADTVIVATAAPITITLPLAPTNGRQLTIKSNGVATGGNPITVNGNGKNIDAAATNLITTTYGFINIVFNTALNKWLTI